MDAPQKAALVAAVATLVAANQAETTALMNVATAVDALEVGGDTTALEQQIAQLTATNSGLQTLIIEVNEKVTESTALAIEAVSAASIAKTKADATLARLQLPLDSQS